MISAAVTSALVQSASSTGPDSGLAGLTVDLMEKLGLFGVALAVGADNIFPPIPSEIILPLAGFAAAQGTFSLAGALFATTAGSVIGKFMTLLRCSTNSRSTAFSLKSRKPIIWASWSC